MVRTSEREARKRAMEICRTMMAWAAEAAVLRNSRAGEA